MHAGPSQQATLHSFVSCGSSSYYHLSHSSNAIGPAPLRSGRSCGCMLANAVCAHIIIIIIIWHSSTSADCHASISPACVLECKCRDPSSQQWLLHHCATIQTPCSNAASWHAACYQQHNSNVLSTSTTCLTCPASLCQSHLLFILQPYPANHDRSLNIQLLIQVHSVTYNRQKRWQLQHVMLHLQLVTVTWHSYTGAPICSHLSLHSAEPACRLLLLLLN